MWFANQQERERAELAMVLLFKQEEEEQGIIYGPVEFYEETERLPVKPTPESRALVGAARIMGLRNIDKIELDFLTELKVGEVKLLRDATLRAYRNAFPGAPDLPLHNIDQLICARGPDVARRLLRAH